MGRAGPGMPRALDGGCGVEVGLLHPGGHTGRLVDSQMCKQVTTAGNRALWAMLGPGRLWEEGPGQPVGGGRH